MKIIQYCILSALLLISNSVFSQKSFFVKMANEEVPAKMEIGFYNIFKNAQNVKWFIAKDETKTLYKGELTQKGKVFALVFDDGAELIKEIISNKKNVIPDEISDYFASNYKGYKLNRLSKVSMLNSLDPEQNLSYYVLTVKVEEREISFQFEEDHELFKGKEYFEEVNYLR